jgi:hypothetical protein
MGLAYRDLLFIICLFIIYLFYHLLFIIYLLYLKVIFLLVKWMTSTFGVLPWMKELSTEMLFLGKTLLTNVNNNLILNLE